MRVLILVAVLPSPALAEDRFPDHKWGVDPLILLEAGPDLLSPDLPLGLRPPPGSGHSTQIHTLAGVLSAIRPACEETYRIFSTGVAFRREIAGVHYPSDTRAGGLIAASLVPRLLAHPELAASLRGAGQEVEDCLDEGACEITGGLR